MPSNQESMYQVSRIIRLVADDLSTRIIGATGVDEYEILEFVERLDLAVELIRSLNGGGI